MSAQVRPQHTFLRAAMSGHDPAADPAAGGGHQGRRLHHGDRLGPDALQHRGGEAAADGGPAAHHQRCRPGRDAGQGSWPRWRGGGEKGVVFVMVGGKRGRSFDEYCKFIVLFQYARLFQACISYSFVRV